LNEEEATSAEQLSQKLSGHALAISAMAGLIHRRALSITEFMNFYNQYHFDFKKRKVVIILENDIREYVFNSTLKINIKVK